MRRNGVLIDREHFVSEAERLTGVFEHLENIVWQQASEAIGEPTHFNIGSYQQKGDILFNKMGLKIHAYSDKGAPSTSESALAELRWDNPIVNNCVVHAQMKKMLSSYLKKFPALIEQDGRIHTSFNQTGVVTGRYSSSDPNLQNIPNIKEWVIKGKDSEKVVVNTRDAFTVPEGWRWLAFDYSQIEARIAAGLTKEVELLTAFRDGVDFHTKTASMVFGVAVDRVTKSQRQMGKKLNFLLLYGGESKKLFSELIKEMKVTKAECKNYRDLYYNAYPRMFREADRIAKDAYMTHSVNTIYDRKIPVPMLGSSDKYERSKGERQAYNGIVQGSAGDIMKMALISTDKLIQKSYSLDAVKAMLTVHDEVDFEVSPDVDMRDLIIDSMKTMRFYREGYPDIYTEPSLGTRWGSLTEINKGESIEQFVDRCLGERPKIVTVEGRVDKTFVLELPAFAIATQSRVDMARLSEFIRSKPGNNSLEVRLGVGVRIIKNTGISIEDKDKILLMTNGKFYEKLSDKDFAEI
jgi:DNA polymerase-1